MVSVAQCVVLTALYTSCSLPEWHPCWHHIISCLSQFLCPHARLHLQSLHECARSTNITTMLTESGHPIFRATTPLSRSILKSKGHGKLSIHYCADYPTIETIFRIIISANQFSLYGAVANICEEFEAHQDRSGNLMYWWDNQLFSVKLRLCRMKTLHIIKFYGNTTKNESNHFHKKAKWVNSVWKQDLYMLLKWDSISWQKTLVILDNFVQWLVDESSQPRGWIQGNTRIGPV